MKGKTVKKSVNSLQKAKTATREKEKIETIGGQEVRKEIKNRLSRVIGTMNGIKKMVEDGLGCNEILIQISAAMNATKSIANFILASHLNEFVAKEIESGNKEKAIKDVVSYFKRFE